MTGPGALLTLFALLAFAALRRHARHPELARRVRARRAGLSRGRRRSTEGVQLPLLPFLRARDGRARHDRLGPARVAAELGAQRVPGHRGQRRSPRWSWPVCAQNAASAMRLDSRLGTGADGAAAAGGPRPRRPARASTSCRTTSASAYPLINYSGARSASRFAQLWILASAYMDQLKGSRPLRYHAPGRDEPERALPESGGASRIFGISGPSCWSSCSTHATCRSTGSGGWTTSRTSAATRASRASSSGISWWPTWATSWSTSGSRTARRGRDRHRRSEPGTRDIVPARQAGGGRVRIGDPGLLLALLAFVVSAILASIAEKARARRRSRRDGREVEVPAGILGEAGLGAHADRGADLGLRLLAGLPASAAQHVGLRADLGRCARPGVGRGPLRRRSDHRHALPIVLPAYRRARRASVRSVLPFPAARVLWAAASGAVFAWAALRYGARAAGGAAERELPERR